MDKKQELALKLGALVRDIENILNKASDTVSASCGYWTGDASDKARSEFGFQLEEVAHALESVKKNMESLMVCENIDCENDKQPVKNKMLDADMII